MDFETVKAWWEESKGLEMGGGYVSPAVSKPVDAFALEEKQAMLIVMQLLHKPNLSCQAQANASHSAFRACSQRFCYEIASWVLLSIVQAVGCQPVSSARTNAVRQRFEW